MNPFFHTTRVHSLLAASTLTVALLFGSAPSRAQAEAPAQLRPFVANYSVHYMKVHAADVRLELERDRENWLIHRRARAVGIARWLAGDKIKLDEESWFKLVDNRPAPTRYVLKQPGAKRGRRRIEIVFSDKQAVISNDKDETKRVKISDSSQDQVSAVLAVMMEMQAQPQNFQLPVVGRRGEDSTRFEVIKTETLETRAGKFKTIHLVQNTKKRATNYWLAIEHNMVPVKIRHQEKDNEGAEMLLESFSFQ